MTVAVEDSYNALSRRAGQADVENLNRDRESTDLHISMAAQDVKAARGILDDRAVRAAAVAPANDRSEIAGVAQQIRISKGGNHRAEGDFARLR